MILGPHYLENALGSSNCIILQHERGRGGVDIPVGPNWAYYIVNREVSPCHRDLWIMFSKDGHNFGICNFYAPNDYRDRETLWEWTTSNFPSTHWIFFGDLNMVEYREEKVGGKSFSWKGNELFFWHTIKRNFNVLDPIERIKYKFQDIW